MGAGEFFDTLVRIRADCSQELMDVCLARCARFHAALNRFDPTSDVGRLNAAGGRPVEVDQDTADALRASVRLAEETCGAFDASVGAASALWDFKRGTVPSEALLRAAVGHIGWRHLHVCGRRTWLDDPAARIDLGGMAKGFVTDDLVSLLRNAGCVRAVLDLGGNVHCLGTRPDGRPWRVGVADPDDTFGRPLAACELGDQSLVTSSVRTRAFERGGVRYAHILDPRTGAPLKTNLASASVLCARSTEGEGLGKLLLSLGCQGALDYVNGHDGIECLLVRANGEVTQSAGGAFSIRGSSRSPSRNRP